MGLLLYALVAPLPAPALAAGTGGVLLLVVVDARYADKIFAPKDDSRITIDEVGGTLVALIGLPVRLDVAVCGFLLFRLFDIWKPQPVRAAESLSGGVGVMADDVVAGLYANLCGQLLWRVVGPGGLV